MRGAPLLESDPPRVLVQLPVFNERYVVERLIRAVAALDYPRSRLAVQVLDDSTDDTGKIADRVVEECAAAGLDIRRLHRTDRRGFKAGALQVGLDASDAPFVAIFDADFVPEPDFLRRTLPYLLADDADRARAGPLGPPEPRLLAAHRRSGHSAGRALHGRTRGAPRRGVLLQLQRDGGHLAAGGDRGRRRLGGRHPDRGSRPLLSRPAPGLEVRFRARDCGPGGTAGLHERLQGAAAPLGPGIAPDRPEAAAADPGVAAPVARPGGSLLPPHQQPRLSVDGGPEPVDDAGALRPGEHRAPGDGAPRHSHLRRRHPLGGLLLRVFPEPPAAAPAAG